MGGEGLHKMSVFAKKKLVAFFVSQPHTAGIAPRSARRCAIARVCAVAVAPIYTAPACSPLRGITECAFCTTAWNISFPPSTWALFCSLVGRHSPNSPKLPKSFQSRWSWLGVCTGLPVRENPRRFHLVLPIPVLVHLTGSVLEEGAPFGSNILRASHVVKGWHGSCSGPIN
jgi:hypothetical protein